MALVADISGVCSVAGTLPMTSMPTSRARMKMVRSVSSAVDTGASVSLQQAGHALVDDPAVVRDHHACLDLVAGVDGQRAVGGQVQQQRGDVPRVGFEAAVGTVAARFSAPTIVTPFPVTDVSPGTEPVTLPPNGLAAMSTMTDPGAMALTASTITNSACVRTGTSVFMITTSSFARSLFSSY